VILNALFAKSPHGRLHTVEGLADDGTLLVRVGSNRSENLLLLKPKN
jgi:hypothetical protein